MLTALKNHWPEYLMEAAGLGFFMISACLFAALLFHPASPIASFNPNLLRVLMGVLMGLTAVTIIYSPWGQRSGAHINPAVTLTFFRLGKIRPWDALFYVAAQFTGAVFGVTLAALVVGDFLAHPAVNYVATVPGPCGAWVAFLAEMLISFFLMCVVLTVSNSQRLAKWTPLCAGFLVATYISLEAPFSGMSMNPARTFGSAFAGHIWTAVWVYFIAPPLGMLLAAEIYVRAKGAKGVICAKLSHYNQQRCIFNCGYAAHGTFYASHVVEIKARAQAVLPPVPQQLF